jgi:dihydroorotase
MASYRLALATEVDAGQMTPEMSYYLVDQRNAEFKTQAATTAAVAAANRPINCATTAGVGTLNTAAIDRQARSARRVLERRATGTTAAY